MNGILGYKISRGYIISRLDLLKIYQNDNGVFVRYYRFDFEVTFHTYLFIFEICGSQDNLSGQSLIVMKT
jgi:hypothetical protein